MGRDGPREYIPLESTHGNVRMDLKGKVRVWGRMAWEMGVICQNRVGRKTGRGREKEMSESGGHINGCIFR